MNTVIQFQPKSQHDAKANLADFIEYSKKLQPLGVDQPFESNIWAAGKAIHHRQGNAKVSFRFTQIVEINGELQKKIPPKSIQKLMEEPFLSFAKAMICYKYALVPTTDIRRSYYALRHLYVALDRTTGSLCPTEITATVLDLACQLLINTYKDPYRFGIELQQIHETMMEFRMVSRPTGWKSFIPLEKNWNRRSGKEFDELRMKKLPAPAALDALAYIFNNPKDNADIAISSICALLLCDPDRIVEVITGPLNCIAKDQVPVNGNLNSGLYLRWFPAKGADPMLKPVTPPMADTARRAIANLEKLGAPARKIALWYEKNPTNIYLPSHLKHMRSKSLLTTEDVSEIMFDNKLLTSNTYTWIKTNIPNISALRKAKKNSRDPYIPFPLLEQLVLSMLPQGFPILNPKTGLKYSEALCVCRVGEIKGETPYVGMLQAIGYDFVRSRLTGNKSTPTIFEKHGFTDEDGSKLIVRTHMFRHYTSMVGITGGLSDIESNKLAGRKSSSHLRTYNSQSDNDVLANVRNAIALNKPELGPLANMDTRLFINRAEFANIRVITAHTTEFGHCLHDYATLPCQLHGDHINCNEHVVIKGEIEQEKNLRCEQTETCSLLEKAKVAMTDEEYGANMWVQEHSAKLDRINQIVSLLDDPNTPAGAVIQASGVVPPSRIQQAIEDRLKNSSTPLFGGMIKSMADVHTLLENQIKNETSNG